MRSLTLRLYGIAKKRRFAWHPALQGDAAAQIGALPAHPSQRNKRILLLSVSAGAGHTRAAQAICAQAQLREACVDTWHLDVMDYVPRVFRWLYTDFYIGLVDKCPTLWGWLYRITDEARPDGMLQKLRRAIERAGTRALWTAIAEFQPDSIICTHFLPAEILSHAARRNRLACPVWVQVTDFDLHRMWVQRDVAGYFAANDEVAYRMRAHGIPLHAIRVTGIPVMPGFRAAPGRAQCAAQVGIDPQRMTLLLMGGGAGLGGLEEIAARLLALREDFQLIVLAGKNVATLRALQRLAGQFPGRLLPCGFTNQVERLMACADLVITKPGGLSTSECLAMGLPMILNSPIPGQEERNADFLLEQGVALKACDAVTLEYRVRYLLQHPAMLAQMRARAAALGRPAAARDVVETVIANLTD